MKDIWAEQQASIDQVSISLPRATEPAAAAFHFPTVPAKHRHARMLLENAMRYMAAESGTIDPVSGYPLEGWNDEPERGLMLRSFTQLTAIGEWLEMLTNIVAGYADSPYLSRDEALAHLSKAVASLRQDQKDPEVSDKGLLVNFIDLASGKRRGILTASVEKQRFVEAFGAEKGQAAWQALAAKGWITPCGDDREAAVHRGVGYGSQHFDGPLAALADEPTKQRIMSILDQRVVMIVFGDNANLTTSAAKAVGALLAPEIKDDPRVAAVREQMEQFLEDQREGYAALYDPRVQMIYFGWDATRNRLFGWSDGQGNWQPGYVDYMVNEFRGPTKFVVLRYGLPVDAVANLGFKMKSYRTAAGEALYVLAPWEGSTFQALGLGLSMTELDTPIWRKLLENLVDVELDYTYRHGLPGFLSESYTGEGLQYTGDVGIPEIAVSTSPRITTAPSLYTLGVAYMIAPEKVEQFLAANWPAIARLLTDHGPWEGFSVAKQEAIEVQTSAHTFSLILGMLGTGSDHMRRYIELKGLDGSLAEMHRSGPPRDLMAEDVNIFAWANDGVIQSARNKDGFQVKGDRAERPGIALVPSNPEGVNLSGGVLTIRYRSGHQIDPAVIALKAEGNLPPDSRLIAKELFASFADTGGRQQQIDIPLPATPGLTRIKEVVITCGHGTSQCPIDLQITGVTFTP